MFRWTAFSFFSPRSRIDDGIVGPLSKAFSSTCLMLSEPLFHNLSPMSCGIVILEYARATVPAQAFWGP